METRSTDTARAWQALESVQDDPAATLETAVALLARSDLDADSRSLALWAQGRAEHELDRVGAASASLRQAIDVAEGHGLGSRAALIRTSLAACRFNEGESGEAFELLDRAEAEVTDDGDLGRVIMQRALLWFRSGEVTAARAEFDRALPHVLAAGDELAEARLRANRGIQLLFAGEHETAEDDLTRAQDLAVRLDQRLLAAGAQHNLGYLEGRMGDLPASLMWFERAARSYAELDTPLRLLSDLLIDQCEVLLAAQLWEEARTVGARAVEALEESGNVAALAEARVMTAEAMLAGGDVDGAAALAERAVVELRGAGREARALRAEYVALRARLASGAHDDLGPAVARATHIAAGLEQSGWLAESLYLRTEVGRLALEAGDLQTARRELGRAAEARRAGDAERRARAWLALARLRLAEGDVTSARRAVSTGHRVVRNHQTTLGATELRARAGGIGRELAELGVALARERGGGPADVLRWADRARAGVHRTSAVRGSGDRGVETELSELRALRIAQREAAAAGTPDPSLVAQIESVERTITTRARTAAGRALAVGALRPAELRAALDGRCLVEFVEDRGSLCALTVGARRTRLHELGPIRDLSADIDDLVFDIKRMALGVGSDVSLGIAAAGVDEMAADLDRRLLGPLRLHPDRELVVVPTGELHRLPWAALPSLRARTVTITPSATAWMGTTQEPGAQMGTIAIAGPGLVAAEREVATVARHHRIVETLVGAAATAESVLEAFEHAAVVHVAAHGDFRADNPMFSSLQMADGPLTLHDLERLAAVPSLVVLPACDAAQARVHTGDELLGLASALLSLGVGNVIAPVTIVDDESAADLMDGLHAALAAGASPPAALATAAGGAWMSASGGARAAAASFVCVGRRDGHRAVPGRRISGARPRLSLA